MTIKRELTAVQKKITAIKLKVDNLIAAVEKAETKPTKAAKAPVKKKVVRITDTDKVLNIIKRSKKGVDTVTLVKKTGFDQKKVRNILQRTFKQGKIKRAAKGIYIGA